MPVSAGARLGPYEILDLVGSGGMGEVYRARDPRLGREVAIKVLPDAIATDRDRLRRFEQEARAVAALSHANVVVVHDVGSEGGQPYLVTELLEGATLAERLRKGPLAPREAIDTAVQVAHGLAAAHAKKIAHRDLKPGNVFLTRDGRVKILDFGLARWEGSSPEETTTSVATDPGTRLGTVGYMSPEQVRGGRGDHRSDIFAFGVLLYEMVSGRNPFRRTTGVETQTAILREEPPTLADLTIPETLERVIRRCLEKRPEDRFHSAHDLALALQSIAGSPPTPLPPRSADLAERGPYPGLRPFTEELRESFFGREAEVRALWEKLQRRKLLALIGPSGVGKTSFLRAGLVPARPPGWRCVTANPGRRPFASLARALVPELASDTEALQELVAFDDPDVAVRLVGRWRQRYAGALVIVDQLEELFTLNAPQAQAAFAELLRRLCEEADVRVLLSLRDDFFFACHAHAAFAEVFSEVTPLGPLAGDALRRALVEPAQRSGFRFEDEALVEEMCGAVEGERGALPLLAFCAAELWVRRDQEGRLLTRAACEEIGGVAGALARHAEATLDQIGAERQEIVREIFRNLATAEGTRAACERKELVSVFPQRRAAEEVLRALLDARLLTSYEDEAAIPHGENRHRIEIVHESLLTAWPRLVRWRTQDEEGAQLRDQLKQAAHLWQEKGRPADLLWSGTSFREYELWRERYAGALTAPEEDFARSMAERARRRKRLLHTAVASAFVLLAAVATTIGISHQQATTSRDQAKAEALRAEAAQLLALAQNRLADDPTEALALTTSSLQLADTQEARSFVMRALWEAPPALELDIGSGARMPAFSPEGRFVALAGHSTDVRVFAQDGRSALALPGHEVSPRGPNVAAWVQEGLLATGLGGGGGIAIRLQLWSLPRGDRVRTIDFGAPTSWLVSHGQLFAESLTTRPNTRQFATVRAWALPDGEARTLGVVDWTGLGATSSALAPDGSAWLYTKGAGVYARALPFTEGSRSRLVERYSSDVGLDAMAAGPLVARDASGKSRIWPFPKGPAAAGTRLQRTRDAPATIVSDRSGRHLLGFDWWADARLRLWDAGAASALPLVLRRSGSWYGSWFAFHPRSDWVAASTHSYSRLTFWPLRRVSPIVFDGYSQLSRPLAFSVDGRWVATSWDDSALRLWAVPGSGSTGTRLLPLPGGQTPLWRGFAFDPQGRYLFAVGNADQAWMVPLDGSPARKLPAFSEDTLIDGAAVSPSGRYLAWAFFYGRGAKTLRVWDTVTDRLRTLDLPKGPRPPEGAPGSSPATGFEDGVESLGFGDETTLYTTGDAGLIRWNLKTGSHEIARPSPGPATTMMVMAASENGRSALIVETAAGRPCSSLRLHDLPGGRSRPLQAFGCGAAVALDPSGAVAAVGDDQGIVRVGRADRGEPHLLVGHTGSIQCVAISPDLRWVATAGEDNTLRFWPMPDLSHPPLHGLPQAELLTKLRSLTNLRAVRDASSTTGWKIELGPFPGWKNVPDW